MDENSISELRKTVINDTPLEIMIRGNNRDNPVLVFVHGGPCCSEIPYVKKYQNLLEQSFTIVHYDQRGSGKSYQFGTDYSEENEADITYLRELKVPISQGEGITPREYVRKYGFATRNIDENTDYLKGFLFGSEYNLLDAIRFYTASSKYQNTLVMEALNNPISDIVTEINIPVYFVMGQYDCMTSPEAAAEFLDSLDGDSIREIVMFEESAHYPQLEEKEKFYRWMCDMFVN